MNGCIDNTDLAAGVPRGPPPALTRGNYRPPGRRRAYGTGQSDRAGRARSRDRPDADRRRGPARSGSAEGQAGLEPELGEPRAAHRRRRAERLLARGVRRAVRGVRHRAWDAQAMREPQYVSGSLITRRPS